ncbi:Catalyzes the cleavage of p-aminobenzoyl-glutamate to p-aminobenzoate and glutamate, subunit A [Caballeronia glathei]|jgi:hippurate hydrolase|uniref:Amidohydrolase n=1 Tax=Caballeronia glathei TaxID=60547 RepID=A0A069PNL9_9BURK|nr:M20 aminoacylase family protein [Caballeronia glathei]KDR42052.1 amidohydrolase [Caballeronia glathei]CDY77693.1 Catalyzes the cleavage of p-aminobenzoyl-glutamate to p-aminobenzoate and glutamate, subunit A [Caballeronia glathei]
MQIIPEIAQSHDEIEAIRRDIHAHPELCYEEERTADLVAQKLESWDIEVTRGLGKTGVVGVLRRGTGKRAIGLRADMDALPIPELNTFAHASQHKNKMHACGHDGHTAMLLGAAKYLAQHRHFDGTVVFIFQPAEEGGGGAKAMIGDGLFTRFPVDAVFALHNWPGMPAGNFGARVGATQASSNEFEIRIKGVGSHAAIPHDGIDPVFTAMQIGTGLQSIMTRNKRPIDAAVLSVTQIRAGHALNVIPDEATLAGTVRTFSVDVLDLIETRMKEIAAATATAYRCTAEVSFVRNYPPTVNTESETRFALGVMQEVAGTEYVDTDVDPTMGAEDFSYMLMERPGCYAYIGNGTGGHREHGHGIGPCMLHNSSYDFNDEVLSLGATYWVRLVEKFLKQA